MFVLAVKVAREQRRTPKLGAIACCLDMLGLGEEPGSVLA